MRAIVLLAHSGHLDQNGTVHALGLGWTTSPTPTAQHVLIAVRGGNVRTIARLADLCRTAPRPSAGPPAGRPDSRRPYWRSTFSRVSPGGVEPSELKKPCLPDRVDVMFERWMPVAPIVS